jgi:hypothetical protein
MFLSPVVHMKSNVDPDSHYASAMQMLFFELS